MRDNLYKTVDKFRQCNIYGIIGGGYERGWFTNCKCRYRLFEGARNTKKSRDIGGYEPIFKILSNPLRNIVFCRQNDVDNRQSTYANICFCIEDLGLKMLFDTKVNPLEITYKPTGQKIVFRGLNNPTSITSITFEHGYLTDVYIEEAFQVQFFEDFRKLDGSLRGKLPQGLSLQITLMFNAWDGESWLYEEFFKGRLEDDYELLDNPKVRYLDYIDENWLGPFGKGLYLHKSTYKINEFRDKEIYDAVAAEAKKKYPEQYKVEFLGMFGVTTGKVYTNFDQSLIVPIQDIIKVDFNGQPILNFADFSIGIDTGLSNGEGKIKVIKKGDNQDIKIKAATTMSLNAITADYNKIVVIDEYFHSNNPNDNMSNTDNRDSYTEPQQLDACCRQILAWINEFESSPTILMKGLINIYVDNADIGFRQALEIKLREWGIYNCNVLPSTKKAIRTRIAFTNLLMAYGDMIICDRNKNLIREIKNCRKGEKNVARADGNDHEINAHEYSVAPFYTQLNRWKTFKEH